LSRAVTDRGRSLMKVLTETPVYQVKREVEEMTAKEAREIWSHLEPFFPGVCSRVSIRKRNESSFVLMKKMDLIRLKAEEADKLDRGELRPQ
jgi:hypothetical protein